MVRNTNTSSNNWALKEEEESIELDLGLSVGGSYSKQNATVLDPAFEEIKDQKTKREIHALRRQEAKKKQQLKRGLTKNDAVLLKANDFEPECKKFKTRDNGPDLNFTGDGKFAATCTSSPVPAVNGFVYPCGNVNVMPCWLAGGGAAGAEEKNGFGVKIQPVVGYGFVPLGLDHGYGAEENCSGDGGNRKSGSNGSTNCTSSSGSDHRSPFNEGGGSNSPYTRGPSSPMQQQPQPNNSKMTETKSGPEHTISNISEYSSIDEPAYTNAANVVPSNSIPNSQSRSEPEPYPLTENKKFGNQSKPPKPPSKDQTNSPLPYMPCVSTTGNGPNGKTVNGFLYRYTKTNVSIVCVCHGSSFSPAEFVQHAGGTDILHPLKHITVIRSAF